MLLEVDSLITGKIYENKSHSEISFGIVKMEETYTAKMFYHLPY